MIKLPNKVKGDKELLNLIKERLEVDDGNFEMNLHLLICTVRADKIFIKILKDEDNE